MSAYGRRKSQTRRRSLGGVVVAVGALIAAGAGPAAAVAAKQPPVPPGGKNSAGKTLCEVQQQAAAESLRVLKGCKPGSTRAGAGNQHERMMPMADAGSPAQVVTVQGPTNLDPKVGGRWDNAASLLPGTIGSVHAVQLYTGKVLIMAGSGNQYNMFAAGKFTSYVWDPSAADQSTAFTPVPTPYDMFCAGHSILADGTVLITGGTTAYPQYDASGNLVHDWDGSKESYVFDPNDNAYHQVGSMKSARWYPSTVTTGSGKVIVVGGLDDQARNLGLVSHNTDSVEIFDPLAKTWSSLPPLNFSLTDPSHPVPAGDPGTTRTLPYYPGLVQLEDGRIFYSGESNGDNGVRPGVWDPTSGGFQSLDGLTLPYQRNAGATVLLPPAQNQKVMVMGGGDFQLPSTGTTRIINLKGVSTSANVSPAYTAGPTMSAAKMYVGAVVLPDYTVFETNGASSFRQGGVHTAEVYNPATNKLSVMNSPTLDRLYHSEAFLMPDGRVAVLGSQPLDGSFEMHVSIYSPTYMFKGQRPNIGYGVKTLDHNGGHQGYYDITLAPGATLSKMSLVRPSATTHSTDTDQRLINLTFQRSADGRAWTVDVPTNPNLVPPGWYMMFATDNSGRPSAALWVHVS